MENRQDNMITPDFDGAAEILKGYKNKYEGKRCFIIGNGPSLKASDLDKIKENGDFSIASNRIYLIFKDTEWRPDIYTTVDEYAINILQDEISAVKAELKIIPVMPQNKIPHIDGALTIPLSTHQQDYNWILQDILPPFSDDITRIVYNGKTITYMNLQIAVYLGFKEIILLGMDHYFPRMGFFPKINQMNLRIGDTVTIRPEIRTFEMEGGNKSGHFCDNYYEGLCKNGESHPDGAYQIEAATLAYKAANKYAADHGIKIFNATRGGKLEVFERVNFDDIIKKNEKKVKMVKPNFERAAKILRGYKNKYEGKRCFIIGNGPSLKAEDLDKIHENGDFSIASNRIYLIFKDTKWRPDIYTTKDAEGIEKSLENISGDIAKLLKIVIVSPFDMMYPVEGALPIRIGKTNNMYLMTRELPAFSDDITRCVYTTVTITYTNIQIAAYLGFREIILLGVDHHYAVVWHFPSELQNYDVKKNKNNYKQGEILSIEPELQFFKGVKNHFCDNYMDGLFGGLGEDVTAFAIDEATLSYQAARKYALEHKIKIVNATRGGRLNVFKRVNFDSLFPKK